MSRAPGPFTAGAARVEITPEVGLPLAGYSRRAGRPSTGAHDPLYARAVALSDGADLVFVISADLLVIPPGFVVKVAQGLDEALPEAIGVEDVLLAATHTHSGPGAYLPGPMGRLTAGRYRTQEHDRLVRACVEAGRLAALSLRPARLAVTRTTLPQLVENRVDPEGPVDPELTVIGLLGDDSRPIATLLNFAAHPTLLSSKNMLYSADFPGVACRVLEQRQPGAVALFTNGAAADLRPRHVDGLHNFDLAERIGTVLADEALLALETSAWGSEVEVGSIGGAFTLPPARIDLGWLTIPHAVVRWWIPDEAMITVVGLNGTSLVSAPADLASEIGVRIKSQLASRGLTGIVVGYANDYAGYIVPARWYRHPAQGGYETRMSWHGPDMETVYEAIVLNLAEEYLAHGHRAQRPVVETAGLPVVVLRGDPRQIGYEHGHRYRAQVQASIANLMTFIESKAPKIPFRSAFVRWRLSSYFAQMKPFIPAAYLDEMAGLAEGSGVPLKELERIHALPEIASIWCTNSVVFGRATWDGRLIHLRNLDWAIHSDVQRYSAVFVYHPTGARSFVSIGYFGFIGCLSGINDVGISAGQIGAKTVDQTVRGTPMPILLRQALEASSDLETAVRLVREARRTSGFHYVFADGERRRAVALETTKSHCAVFWAGDEAERAVPYAVMIPDVMVRADPALDPAVREVQRCSKGDPSTPGLEPPAGKAYEVRYRQHALLIADRYGRLDPEGMMGIAKQIAPPSNVQSIIFAWPTMWVATARGSTPAAESPYLSYDLEALLQS